MKRLAYQAQTAFDNLVEDYERVCDENSTLKDRLRKVQKENQSLVNEIGKLFEEEIGKNIKIFDLRKERDKLKKQLKNEQARQ